MNKSICSLFFILSCSNFHPEILTKWDDARVAAIYASNKQGFCSGVWISEDEIITARHCIINLEKVLFFAVNKKLGEGYIFLEDPIKDLAIIKVSRFLENREPVNFNLPIKDSIVYVKYFNGRYWDSIETKVIAIDYNLIKLDWNAPKGASGAPVFGKNGKLNCILTKSESIDGYYNPKDNFNYGSYCSIMQN
jgi:V8-like Glu-specific endopeptidase